MSIFYLIRMYRATFASVVSLLSAGGFASAIIGIFCLSCSSLFLGLLPSFFSIPFLFLLPFRGLEFGLLSIALLCVSLWFSYKKLSSYN